MRLSACFAAIAMLAAPLQAADSAPTAQQAEKPAPKVKKICRATPVTGSNFPKRVCRTAAEWAELSAEDADMGAVNAGGGGRGARSSAPDSND